MENNFLICLFSQIKVSCGGPYEVLVLWPKLWLEIECRVGKVTRKPSGHLRVEPAQGCSLLIGMMGPQNFWIVMALPPMICDFWAT
jgi:hypothetical protein